MTKISNQYSLTNILTADLANSRLGINNVSPTVALDVTGAGKFSGALTVTGGIIASAANGNIRIKGSTDGFLGAGESDNKLYLTDWTTAAKGLIINLTNGASTFSSSVTMGGDLVLTPTDSAISFSSGAARFFTGGSERMRITSDGYVGIGTTSPLVAGSGYKGLDIRGTTGGSLALGNTSLVYAYVFAENTGLYLSAQNSVPMNFFTSGNQRMTIKAGGYIDLNNVVYNDTASGSPRNLFIASGGTIGGISSIRASKKNIQNVTNIDWLYQLNPVTFNYRKKDENRNYTEEVYDELTYGLIAEDTQPIADFLINYDDSNSNKEMIGIEYMKLITPMLKAIQELSAKVSLLENK